MSYPYIIPGNDLTKIPIVPGGLCGEVQEVSAAMIQELVANILPGEFIGFVWVSATAPDVEADPDFKKFLWIDINAPWPYPFRVYNLATLTWDQWTFPPGSISGTAFIDGSIPPSKLATGGIGNAKKILQVDIQGKAFIYVFAKDAIDDNTLPVGKLHVPPGTPTGSFLQTTGPNSVRWALITSAYLISLIEDGSIPISKLAPGSGQVNQSIRLETVDGKLQFVFYTPSAGGGLPDPLGTQVGYVLTIVENPPSSGTFVWEAKPSQSASAGVKFKGAPYPQLITENNGMQPAAPGANIPTAFRRTAVTNLIAHQGTLPGVIPKFFKAFFKCKVATVLWNGYKMDDEVPIEAVTVTDDVSPFTIWCDGTTINCICALQEGALVKEDEDSPAIGTGTDDQYYALQFPGPTFPSAYAASSGIHPVENPAGANKYYTLYDLSRDWDLWYYIIM